MIIIIKFVDLILRMFELALIIEVILSWVRFDRYDKFVELIHNITEPLLQPGRRLQERFIPNLMVDFSPIIAFFIIDFLRRILSGLRF